MNFLDELYHIERRRKADTISKRYGIKINQYCGLARQPEFHAWLKDVALDLQKDLEEYQKTNVGCSANRRKMIEIQGKLHKRGLIKELMRFLKQEYPNVIEG